MYNYFCGFSKNATRMAYSVYASASSASSSSSTCASGVVASAAAEWILLRFPQQHIVLLHLLAFLVELQCSQVEPQDLTGLNGGNIESCTMVGVVKSKNIQEESRFLNKPDKYDPIRW